MNISGRKVGLAAVLVMALMLGIWSEADSKTPATRTRTEKAEPRLKVSRQIPQKLPQGWFKTATRNGEYEAIRLHRFLDEIVVEGYNVNVDDGHHCSSLCREFWFAWLDVSFYRKYQRCVFMDMGHVGQNRYQLLCVDYRIFYVSV